MKTHTTINTFVKKVVNSNEIELYDPLTRTVVYAQFKRSAVGYAIETISTIRDSLQSISTYIQQFREPTSDSVDIMLDFLETQRLDRAKQVLIEDGVKAFLSLDHRSATLEGDVSSSVEAFGASLFTE